MKKILLSTLILFSSFQLIKSQNVAINTTGVAAAASAMLDVSSTTSGLLVPRMTSAQRTAIAAPATGLLVYDLTLQAFWYFDGTVWRPFLSNNTGWTTTGNAGTTPASNFMGSTDNVDVAFRTNNTEAFRMTTAQKLLVGVTTPTAPSTQKVEIYAAAGDGLWAHSPNVGGWLGYETNFSFGTPAQNILGSGVWAANPAAGYTSLFAQSTGSASVAASILYSNVWMAGYNLVDNASNIYNPSASYNQLGVTNSGLGGTQIALRGWSERGTTAGNPGYTVGVQGLADAQNQDAIGVQGIAYSSSGGVSTGGYFEGLTYPGTSIAYAYVGGWINGATARKIVGTGSVSEVVPTENYGRVTLTCPESPEYWYQDYGSVQLVNGKAHVDLDPIVADIVVIDANNPIRAAFTPQDMLYFNGAAIVNITPTGFDIVELNGGTNSGTVQYALTMKPKTNYGEGRFPQGPGPSYLKSDKEPLAAKTKNQPKYEDVFHWPADNVVYKYNPEDMVEVGEMIPAGPHAGKIKLGNGKYLDYVPANRLELR